MRAGDTVFMIEKSWRRPGKRSWSVRPVMFHCLYPGDAERWLVQTDEPKLACVPTTLVFERKRDAMAELHRIKALAALERTA